jgi:hypothetical protein
MAGKTLPGIGDDESGEHDPAEALRLPHATAGAPKDTAGVPKDTSSTLSNSDKTPAKPARATDRMPLPMRTIIGAPPVSFDGPTATSVDDDKVAEGLKRLRSLDEPLGPIPNSLPTLKEGIPVVTDGPATAPAPAAPTMTVADMIRSRGTAHGHALSTPGSGQGLVPMAVDDRLKGTLLGHSLHLPDLPAVTPEENRTPEVRAIATVVARSTPTGSQPATEQPGAFSHGDARFFESEPINTEMEPEHPRSTKVVRGIAIAAALAAVFIVAAVAYTHSQKSDSAETAPAEPKPASAEGTPAPAPAPENTAAAPAPAAAALAPAAAAPAPTPAPAAAAQAPAPAPAPAPAEKAPEETPSAEPKRDLAAASAPKTTPPPPPSTHSRSSHPSTEASSHSAARPSSPTPAPRPTAAPPGKRKVGVEEDPDGTLPLTE